jgi:predicted transposase YdaD
MTQPPHKPHNPHDRFFRSAMENRSVALAFMRYYLPEPVFQALDTDSLILQHDSYIDTELAESLSDLVYHCQLAGEDACISILIEHQSRPDVFMPVRIGHYLFSLLTKQLKQRQPHSTATESKKVPRRLLTPVYALVFYHGQTSPYPYSLQLADCFNDPLKLMANLFQHPIALIDINQLPDDQLKQQQWIGIVARALKHIRAADISPYLLDLLQDCEGLDDHSNQWLDFIRTLLHYAIGTGNVIDLEQLVESSQQLPKPIGDTFMTIAEQLEARGIEKGKAQGITLGEARGLEVGRHEGLELGRTETQKTTALNMLKESLPVDLVVKVTGLSQREVEVLQQGLQH